MADEKKIAEDFDAFVKGELLKEANKIREEKGYPLVDKDGKEIPKTEK